MQIWKFPYMFVFNHAGQIREIFQQKQQLRGIQRPKTWYLRPRKILKMHFQLSTTAFFSLEHIYYLSHNKKQGRSIVSIWKCKVILHLARGINFCGTNFCCSVAVTCRVLWNLFVRIALYCLKFQVKFG